MAQRPTLAAIAADRAILNAIEEMVDYQPANTAYSTASLQQLELTLTQAEETEERARRSYEQARLVRTETAQAFHEAIRNAKIQVVAQYGDDSFAVQAIGLTRKSERKRPVRRVAAA